MSRPTHTELEEWIDLQPPFMDPDWLSGLEARKREEANFHDDDRRDHRDEQVGAAASPNRRFYQAARPAAEAMLEWMNTRLSGKVFLDYACGGGRQTLAAAHAGAALAIGIDISPVSVRNGRENAMAEGESSRTRFLQRDCEDTGLPAGSIDRVMCNGMLHHLDLHRAFPELHRILAPGGEVFCHEALAYNPAIKLYRRLTPELRTEWERAHILGMKDIRLANEWFEVRDMRFHCLMSPLATFLPSGTVRRVGLDVCHAVDSLLTKLPYVQLWSWIFTFRLVRR